MTTRRPDAQRRIDIARARLERWTDHRRTLGLDPAELEALAVGIEEATEALWSVQRRSGVAARNERRLRRALEDLRIIVETLGRGIAQRQITERQADYRHSAGVRVVVRRRGAPLPRRPAITGIGLDPLGRVALRLSCPGLGHDPDLCVRVRRRTGRKGTYETIGLCSSTSFLDASCRQAGRVAAYKIEVVSGAMAGAWSRRASIDLFSCALPDAVATPVRRCGPSPARSAPSQARSALSQARSAPRRAQSAPSQAQSVPNQPRCAPPRTAPAAA